jgi:predicted amidophosphoribosyltransferase
LRFRDGLPASVVGVLDLLLPRRCASCGSAGQSFCEGCRAGLIQLAPPLCERCGSPGAWPIARCAECRGRRLAFSSARAAVVYDDGARRLVSAWKERGQRQLACVAAAIVVEALARPAVAALAFVPGDRDRSLERGHRPAESLARELGRAWSLPVDAYVRRARSVDPQRGLGLKERRSNVAGAFAPARPSPGSVCLVDDIYTSGATAAAAASALRKGGARRVEVVTFARAVR